MAYLLRFGRPMGAAAVAVAGLGAVQQGQPRSPNAQCADVKRMLSRREQGVSIKDTKLFSAYKNKFGDQKDVELTPDDVAALLADFRITNQYVVARLFCMMDEDGGGTVDIKEMQKFLKTLASGSVAVKTKFLFDCCDIRKSGVVEIDEFREMIKNLAAACLETHPNFTYAKTEFDVALFHDLSMEMIEQVHANRLAYNMFLEADKDKDNKLNFKDFNFWVMRGGKTVNTFLELFEFIDEFSDA